MKIDPTKQFLRHSENCFNFCTWQDITQNQRVLLVSVTRPKAIFLPLYIQHLNVWAEVYRQWGVDQVYLITNDVRYNVLAVNTMARDLPVLGDVGSEFSAELGRHCGMTNHAAEQLSRYWNYQVLINCGELEKVYSQPMDDLVKNLVRDTKDLGLARKIQPMERYHLTPFFLREHRELMHRVMYYRLHPNTDLKNYLLSTSR